MTMEEGFEKNGQDREEIFSKSVRAGKRTYFFDVKSTKGNDYYLTITESRKRFNDNGYDRHKIFLYKEDFNKFIKALTEAVDHVKTQLMPDFDFDAYNHDEVAEGEGYSEEGHTNGVEREATESVERINNNVEIPSATASTSTDDVDKW